jgi:hypothetical protein
MSTTQTITTAAEIPKILESFYTKDNTGLIPRGVAEIYQQTAERPSGLTGAAAYTQMYKPVIEAGLAGAQGVAGLSPFQQYVGQQLSGMQLPGQYGLATEAGQQSAAGLQALQNAQALGVTGPEAARQFTSEEAKGYMSPYMQNVVDRQQAAAIKAAREAQLGQNLAAARQGTYGGARQTLLQGQREAGLQSTLSDIQAKGLQSAYEQAQQQFERDRAAQMSVGQQNLQAQMANQAAQQQANQLRLGAAQGLGGLAGTFGQLGTQQLAGQLDLTKTQGAFGDLQRAVQQQQLDAERGFLTDQAQYGMTQVGQLSNLLRGIPLQSSTQTATAPPPSFASQLTGLGLTGIGLYNMLGGGKG